MNKFSLSPSSLSPWDVHSFPSIDSTNSYAKENLSEFQTATLITADHQTAGRGRGSNIWEDTKGDLFLSTWVLPLGTLRADPRWTMAIGYMVYKNLKEIWPRLPFSIKAPNDIFIEDRKVAGLLIETSSFKGSLYLIIGLGMNVFACPSAYSATGTYLAAGGHENLNQKSWQSFLEHLGAAFLGLDKFFANPQWLSVIKPPLIQALNSNPLQKNNLVRNISDEGSLELHQGYLNWLEL